MFLECDYDGKILFIDNSLKINFDYLNEDFIKSNRLFNLVHSDSLIEFIDFYNFFLSGKLDSFKCSFTFIGSNFRKINCILFFEKFPNRIRLSFLSFDDDVLKKKKFINTFKKFLLLTRVKFVIGSLMPFFFAVPWSYFKYDNVSVLMLFLSFFALLFLHMSANTFNDYFDWKSGRDKKNVDYILFSTGGSRSIDLKLISEKNMLYLSLLLLLCVFIIACYMFYLRGFLIWVIGFFALFSVYFYSAPPIHLASRYGLGELMHILCLGPLIIYGAVYAAVGVSDYLDCLIGIPHGLLITSCLLINEFPDSKFDVLSGKNNLAVVLGAKYIPYVYSGFIFLSFFLLLFICIYFRLSYIFLLPCILIPYSFFTCKLVYKISFDDRQSIYLCCLKSLNIYLYYSIILVIACVLVLFFNP